MATRQTLEPADSRKGYDFKHKLTVVGNSTGVVIPTEVLDELGAMLGDEVGIEVFAEEGRIELEFPVRKN